MDDRTFFLLQTPIDNYKKEDAAEDFFSQLTEILKGEKLNLSVEIAIFKKSLWFFISCPKKTESIINGQWYSQYPNSRIEKVKDYAKKLPNFTSSKNYFTVGTELYLKSSELIPLKTYKEQKRSYLVAFSGLINSFDESDVGILQLVLQPQRKENIWDKFWKQRRKKQREKVKTYYNKPPLYISLEEIKEEKSYFTTTIRLLFSTKEKERSLINLSTMVNILKKGLQREGLQKLEQGGIKSNNQLINDFLRRRLSSQFSLNKKFKNRLGCDEVATIFHLPYKQEEINKVIQITSKLAPPPQNLPREGVPLFGKTNYQGEEIMFGIKTIDRQRHLYIIGKTGMGKTKLLELLITADLKAGRGVIVFDPHGDLARETLSLVPKERIEDIVYFNPSDIEFPIGFNPMEGVGSFEFKQIIVSGFIAIFKKLFGFNWNERFEHVLRYTTLALLDYPHANVLGITRMLTDNSFRQDVISHISDPLVKKFWTTEFAAWNEQYAQEAIVPIINRVGQFVANPIIRNIISQERTSFSLEKIINEGKILIVNLSIGELGEENSSLLGSMLITKIWQTAYARANIKEEERKDVFMYVDEFQNFATTTFTNILSEARKYHLNLTIAHQYIKQLSDEISAAIFGNVGNLISFRVGGEDAQILAREFEPVFSVNDFLNLDLRNFYIKMSIDGKTVKPFSAQTIDFIKPKEDNSEKVIKISRKRWAKPRNKVEKEIERLEKGKLTRQSDKKFPKPIV